MFLNFNNPNDRQILEDYKNFIMRKKSMIAIKKYPEGTLCWLLCNIKVKDNQVLSYSKRKINAVVNAF